MIIRNERQKMDGVGLLASLDDASARLAFFDPQYRAVLDRLAYGNEGARQKRRAALPHMNDETCRLFFAGLERVVKPGGHVMLWLDKFGIVEGTWRRWLPPHQVNPLPMTTPAFFPVDIITWNRLRTGMGRRSRGRTEFLLILQKPPLRAKGVWTDHNLDDWWMEESDRARHPHAKPLQLIQRLIRATTKRDDLVVDPAAGGYCVLEACRATSREFVGCDLV